MLDEFLIEVHSIGQEHVGKGAPVLVEAVSLERHILSKNQRCRGLLGIVPKGLALLWAVDAVEADTFGALVVQNFEGVAVRGC